METLYTKKTKNGLMFKNIENCFETYLCVHEDHISYILGKKWKNINKIMNETNSIITLNEPNIYVKNKWFKIVSNNLHNIICSYNKLVGIAHYASFIIRNNFFYKSYFKERKQNNIFSNSYFDLSFQNYRPPSLNYTSFPIYSSSPSYNPPSPSYSPPSPSYSPSSPSYSPPSPLYSPSSPSYSPPSPSYSSSSPTYGPPSPSYSSSSPTFSPTFLSYFTN